jgi:tRNA A-37 threonylcarbamoyl transferase component Bud32
MTARTTAWTIPSYAEWAVPGYAEERLLGHGVSGRVVVAVNEATGRRVAIKYLEEDLVRDPEFLSRLRAEAERLRSLDAAHMVRLFSYVEQPGQGAAIVMELVDGVSLREMITRGGPLGAAAALVVLKDSLLGLAAAHSRRVPHRDLKPDNVLVDTRGRCTLTDFGVSVKADKQMPAAGAPAYMAPELWHGAPNVPATDLYAATAVFFECVTGKPPFSGRPGHLQHQHESAPVPLDRVDHPLQDLVAWGMAKNPADRPRNARAFLSEVTARAAAVYGPDWEDQGRGELAEHAARLLPLLASGGGGSATATRRARRKMLTFASVAAAALVVLGAVGAYALTRNSANMQLSSSSADGFTAQATVTPPVAASKCATATAFAYSGTVTSTEAGTLSYQWLYSSGKPGPVQTLNFIAAATLPVSSGTVKATKAGSGWAEIKMLGAAAKTSNKATYKLLCGTASSAIAPSAPVQPTAQATSPASAKASAKPSASASKTTAAPKSTATTAAPSGTATTPKSRPTTSPTVKPTTATPTPTTAAPTDTATSTATAKS